MSSSGLRIVADENMTGAAQLLAPLGELRLLPGRDITSVSLSGADALLVRSVTRVDSDLLARTPVRFVGSATSGIDHVDVDWLAGQGIGFAHAPGSNANSVVEYVLAAIAYCDRALEELLGGAGAGIIGYGHIGAAMGARLAALGIDYCVYDPWLAPAECHKPVALGEVLNSRVIVLHPELTREQPWPSHHLLGAQELARIGPDSLLINVSRGSVIDNAALLAWLKAGAANPVVLDVWEGEPRLDPALLQRVRLGTAHIAGYSYDGKLAATRMLAQALAAFCGLPVAATDTSAGDLPVLQAPLASGPELLRQLLQQRYDIAADDARLRAMLIRSAVHEIGAGFDGLRRSYPERRELAGSRVDIDLQRLADVQLLRQLGCTPVEEGA